MELPKGWKEFQRAGILLAGLILSGALQLVVAQKRVSVLLEPQRPQEGQNVTLSVLDGPRQFSRCEWYREPHKGGSEFFLEYIPNQKRNSTSHNQRETVRPDCSLHISRLKLSDTGNYSVSIDVGPAKQPSDQRPTQRPEESYDGFVYLQVEASGQGTNIIPVTVEPPQPRQGQDVTLTTKPSSSLPPFASCEWFKRDSSGNEQSIIWHTVNKPQEPQGTDPGRRRERLTVLQDCSLRITKLTTSDSGHYVVKMQFDRGLQTEQPGQGTGPVENASGQVHLTVDHDAKKDPHKGNSAAGLSHSTGVIAGALLGFFVWTDTLASLFYGLCRSPYQTANLR